MRKSLLSLLFLLFCSTASLYAQQDTQFWFAAPYFNCIHGQTSPYRMVIFAFEENATVTISMPANPSFTPIVQTVLKGGYANIEMASNKAAGDATITTPFNEVSNRGLLVSSTSKIECYYQVEGYNSEAYTLKGKNALGTDFLVAGQKQYNNGSTSSDWIGSRHSIHIVASENNTVVTINPSAPILLADGTSGSGPITVTLQKGETYAVAAYSQSASSNLSGTTITSTKPIAVTSNDDSVYTNGSADAVGEQLVPTDFAGMDFVLVCGGGYYEYCTIFAMHDNTTVTTSDGGSYTLDNGQYQYVSMSGRSALRIESSQPIMVFQVLTSTTGSGELGGTIVPQVHCTGSNIAGYKTFSSGMSVCINLITAKKNISNFLLNGSPISASSFHAVDATEEYYYARLQYTSSTDASYVVQCTSGFFQMGVSEGNSGTSSTYGFFSNYGAFYVSEVEAVFLENSTYSWDNHFLPGTTTPMTFSLPGEYRDTISASDGCDSICILHLQSTGCAPLVTRADTTIHLGDSVFMWATGSDYLVWSPELNKTKDGDLYVKPDITTTYTVSSYKKGLAEANLVVNGDFEQGNTGFTTALHYIIPYTSPGGQGDYTVTDDVRGFWPVASVASHKAYGGSGNMMVVDGATTPNSIVWQQQVTVTPNTDYAFSAYVMSCLESNMQNKYALLQFMVNGKQLGEILHSPTELYTWVRYYEKWNSGSNTTATLTILNQNNSGLGNDYAIDEIVFEPLDILCDSRQVRIGVFESPDTTRFAEVVCSSDLPYTHPSTGIVFPEGTVSGTEKSKTMTNQYGSDSVLIVRVLILPKPVMTVRPDTIINAGESVELWATGVDYVTWSPDEELTRTTDNKVYVSPSATTTYTATGYNVSGSGEGNLVVNGDFEAGNTGFTSALNYRPGFKPTGTSGEYTVNDAVNKFWESSSAPDAATAPAYGGGGLMMIVDGANWTNAIIWQQQVTVTPHTYYTFSAEVMSCLASNKHGKYALLQFSINGAQLGDVFHSPTVLYDWSRYYEVWYSGENTTALLAIFNQNLDHNGNDFALDEIRFEPLHTGCEAIGTVKVSVMAFVESEETVNICDTLMPYSWHGMTLTQAGSYRDTLVSSTGFRDSVNILTLTNYHCCAPINASIAIPDVCADGPTMPIEVTLTTGEINEYTVHFTNPALNTMPFRDTTITIATQYASGTPIILDVPVPYDANDRTRYPRPDDTYTVSLTVSDVCGNSKEWEAQSFTVLYPSWLTEQHWNDVIALVNDRYNGGYTFSQVAWLRDGQVMAGEEDLYIYLPHDLWTDENHQQHASYQYQALLTRADDGKSFLTCPMTPVFIDKTDMMDGNNPYVDVYPRMVDKQNPIVHITTNTTGTYWLYDVAGSLLQTGAYAPCEHGVLDLRLPNVRSMYILLFAPTGTDKPLNDKYRVVRLVVE